AIIPLYSGNFIFDANLAGYLVNQSSFTLNSTVYMWNESFSVTGGSLNLTTLEWTYESKADSFYANYSWNQASEILVTNITESANTTPNVNLAIDGSMIANPSVSGENISLPNYFAILRTGDSSLYIDFLDYTYNDMKSIPEYANISVGYYSTELKGE
ncbi:MAG: hypothetical protein QXN26_01865, partial [Thermoplasmataceae archaeon]